MRGPGGAICMLLLHVSMNDVLFCGSSIDHTQLPFATCYFTQHYALRLIPVNTYRSSSYGHHAFYRREGEGWVQSPGFKGTQTVPAGW